MDNDKFRSRVEGIERMAEDDKAHQELGKRLVQQVAVAVAEEKRGAEITDPDVEFTIAKGQPVPPQFLDQVQVDPAGLAVSDSVVQYLNLRIWIRIWARLWARIVIGPIILATTPLNRFQEFSDRIAFSDDEMMMLRRLDKIGG